MSLTKYQREFVAAMRTAAEMICPEFNIPPQVCVAQSVLETGWGGASKKSSKGKTFQQFGGSTGWNLWGIKGKGDAGSQNWSTKEYKGTQPTGQWITITAAFAKYSSLEAGVRAYCTLLSKERYKLAKDHFSNDPGRYITYVWASGYATSPNYPNIIMSLMRTISAVTRDTAYNVSPDAGLQGVIARMQGVNFGSPRIAVRDAEFKTRFRVSTDPVVTPTPALPQQEKPHKEAQHIAARVEDIAVSSQVLDMDHDGIPDYLDAFLGMCVEPENMSKA